MALTQKELERMSCDMPECTEKHGVFHIHPKCHFYANLAASYENGVLSIVCSDCTEPVMQFAIARE